jgi:cytoplasmic iron level regulating protein YaaA (DUF328/UPF0246 family)
MLILLPPSETKLVGGSGEALNLESLPHPELALARAQVVAALQQLMREPLLAVKAIKVSKPELLAGNSQLLTSPTAPALERYSGVLYDALDFDSLSASEREAAGSRVFVQSALFGLVSGAAAIPWYRLSATSTLPQLNLAKVWSAAHQPLWRRLKGPFLDLRSKAYAALAPIPQQFESYQLEVLDANSGRALNHFNKKAKGAFTRALLRQSATVAGASEAATAAGLKLEIDGSTLLLRVPAGF